MKRDFIVICGAQGYGKTAWTRHYAASKSRLLEFNPKADTPGIDYTTPPDEVIPHIVRRELKAYRYGTYLPEEIEMLWHAAFAAGDTTMINEECSMIFEKGERIPPWARPMIFMGREPKLNLVLVAQRAVSIPIDVRSQATRIVTFLQTEPSDVKSIAEKIGREYAEQIPTLDVLECLDWQPGTGVKRYRISFPG